MSQPLDKEVYFELRQEIATLRKENAELLDILNKALEESVTTWESHKSGCPFQDSMEIDSCNCWVSEARLLSKLSHGEGKHD